MDFGALLHFAKKNNDAATKEEVGLQTVFALQIETFQIRVRCI